MSSGEYPEPGGGCDLFPNCLRCPLPLCRYDEPGHLLREARQRRDQEILRQARQEGRSASELAVAFSIGVRTVQRILRQDIGDTIERKGLLSERGIA